MFQKKQTSIQHFKKKKKKGKLSVIYDTWRNSFFKYFFMRLKTDLSKLRKIICFFFFAYMENFKKGVAIFQLNYEIYPQRINLN